MSIKSSIILSNILVFLLLISFNFSQNNGKVGYTGEVRKDYVVSGEEYVTGEDGNLLMYVNIWGHVKNPGTYLVYDGIDLMTLISLAGGPLSGANLSKIKLIRSGQNQLINLDKQLNKSSGDLTIIQPHDTVYIKETTTSYLVSKANIFSIFIQMVNLGWVITQN